MTPPQPQLTVKILRLGHAGDDVPLPGYATPGSSGMDIRAAVTEPLTLAPGATALIPTGFVIEVPPGFEAQVRPRSGLAVRHGIGILNTPGTIDSDYRGEVKIILTNFGPEPFVVRRGERIAQLVIAPVVRVAWQEISELSPSGRGSGGFGHTGR